MFFTALLQSRTDIQVVSSLHGIVFFIPHVCCVKAFEPPQEVEVAFKVTYY